MRKGCLAALLVALLAPMPSPASPPSPPPTAPPQCRLRHGDHVVLYGAGDDPDVLAWDSRFRLREYHAASFDEAEELLPHAVVESPGTRAVVESCVAAFVESRLFGGAEDAIGIMISSGPDRGLGKWVLGSDVREIRLTKDRR